MHLATYTPIGAVALAIILGIVVGNVLKPGVRFQQGITFSEKHILSFAIALMGVNLNFMTLRELGGNSLLLVIAAMTVTIAISVLLARLFKLDRRFGLLLGIGNGICGSSAIAAAGPLIGAREEEVGLSVAIVNFLGTLGIFLLPFIGTVALGLTNTDSGVLIGNTLQAVGQVVAAGFSISDTTGQAATIVKMTRILMLTPVVLILAVSLRRANGDRGGKRPGIPLFITGFVLFTLVPTFNLLSGELIETISGMSHYALIIAMAGIGLKIRLGGILRNGRAALLVGTLTFLFQILFTGGMLLLLR
ncbi:MAG: putative sulfate exporter family transporter [bacterium]|nr:putative sulfate exporter family transporter [bacterium]